MIGIDTAVPGVYLIHAENGMHYIGFAKNSIAARVMEHVLTMCFPPTGDEQTWTRDGEGAKLLGVFNYKKISWEVVRIWAYADRSWERQLKDCHKPSRFCPTCHGEKAYENMKREI